MSISIVDEKKRVVNSILKAIAISGVLLVTVTYIRDSAIKLSIYNTVFNISALVLMLLMLFFGKSINFEVKTWVITISLIVVGAKMMLINGMAEAGFYLFILSSMVALLIFDQPKANSIVVCSGLTYGIIIMSYALDWIEPVIDTKLLESGKVMWLVRICMYVFLLFIVVGGVGKPLARMVGLLHLIQIDPDRKDFYLSKLDDQALEMDHRLCMVSKPIERHMHE